MARQNVQRIARELYEEAVLRPGYEAPQDYAQLLAIVFASGALVVWCADAPDGFEGVQMGDILYVNGSAALTDHKRRHILAHEWCHWLRQRSRPFSRPVRLYQGLDSTAHRECEERIALAFQRLF